jgi:RHS repeat-associated protein
MKHSYGTLLYRQWEEELEVLLVHPSGGYNRGKPWGIPKGLADAGESPEDAARRETARVDELGRRTEYRYDALGRRVAKTVEEDMTSRTTVFAHSDERIVAQYSSGTAASSPGKEYVYGRYVDELITLIDRTDLGAVSAGSDELLYAHQSHQFHVIALTDNSGNVFERYAYTPYGELTILNPGATGTRQTSDIGNTVTYTGRWQDPETGVYHFQARMLHPRLGRFISRDTLRYIDGTSLYRAYFAMNSTDPTGEQIIRGDINHVTSRYTSCPDNCGQCQEPQGCNFKITVNISTNRRTRPFTTTLRVSLAHRGWGGCVSDMNRAPGSSICFFRTRPPSVVGGCCLRPENYNDAGELLWETITPLECRQMIAQNTTNRDITITGGIRRIKWDIGLEVGCECGRDPGPGDYTTMTTTGEWRIGDP